MKILKSPKNDQSPKPAAAATLCAEVVQKAQSALVFCPSGPGGLDVGRLTDLGSLGAIFHETRKNIFSWCFHGIIMGYDPGK